jgi:hypothetical protein
VLLLLVLVPFWCNPFFWLIRKEVHALHEFAADAETLESKDASALAQLILNTAFPQQKVLFTNPFFQSTIKRRIAMFTKLQHPSIGYASRFLALPILFIVIAAFSLRTKAPHAQRSPGLMVEKHDGGLKNNNRTALLTDTLPKRMYKNKTLADIQYFEWPKKEVKLKFADGTQESISLVEAFNANLFDSAERSRIERRPWAVEKNNDPKLAQGDISVRKASMEEAKKFKGPIMLNDKIFQGTFLQLPVTEKEIAYISIIKGNAFEDLGLKPDDSMLAVSTTKFIEANRRTDNEPLFTKTEVPAKFPDTNGGWQKFLQTNVDASVAVKNGAKPGTYKVMVGFIVDNYGKLHDIKPLTKHGHGMEEEVLRVMKLSPEWIPARQNGKVVTSYQKQPVTIVISEG